MTRARQGLAFAAGTAVISGYSVFINARGVQAFGDATVYTTVKNLVAALLLGGLALAAVQRGSTAAPRRPTTRRGWLSLLAIGLVGGSVPFVLFFEGLARATAADAAFLHKTLLVWVALLAVPLLGERVGKLQVAAIALLLAGQIALTGGLPELAAGSGELMILAATLLWSVEVVVAKRVLDEVPPLSVGLARMGLGTAVLVVWVLVTRGVTPLVAMTATQWWWAAVTGVLLAGYVATWLAALSRAPAVDVTAVLVAGAIITALLQGATGAAALGPQLPGLVLLAAGVALVGRDLARRGAREPVALGS